MLGFVAAVIATDSPSQDRPAVIHSTCTVSCSEAAGAGPDTRVLATVTPLLSDLPGHPSVDPEPPLHRTSAERARAAIQTAVQSPDERMTARTDAAVIPVARPAVRRAGSGLSATGK